MLSLALKSVWFLIPLYKGLNWSLIPLDTNLTLCKVGTPIWPFVKWVQIWVVLELGGTVAVIVVQQKARK